MNKHAHGVFRSIQSELTSILGALDSVIIGQQSLTLELVTAVFAGGHILIEGPPGLGKTHLAKALAKSLGLSLSRVQCTPDLMPADITGSEVLVADNGRAHALAFRRGPLFAPMVLVDEINRATPRTQAAFLEAMQERQVTHLGKRYALDSEFCLIATQNPIELEGTFALPEAQLDRFIFKSLVTNPTTETLVAMTDVSLDEEPAEKIAPQITPERIKEIKAVAKTVVIADRLKTLAAELIVQTHPDRPGSHPLSSKHVRYGASPRGMQSILRTARINALINGRAHVAREDIEKVALPALRHRILLSYESELDGVTTDSVLQDILKRGSVRAHE